MKFCLRRAAAALMAGVLTGGLCTGAALAATRRVGSEAELAALIAGAPGGDNAALTNDIATSAVDLNGWTIDLGSHTWYIGGGTVTNGAVSASGGGGVVRTEAGGDGAVSAELVYVEKTLQLFGAAAGETVLSVTAGGAELPLYANAVMTVNAAGAAVVYPRSDAASAFDSGVTAVTTDAGSYAPAAAGALARVWAIRYSDIIDDTGAAPQQASDVASVNPASYTALDTALTLAEPSLQGARFLGWTWTGQTTLVAATGGAMSISVPGGSLEVTAHWTLAAGGGGGRGGGAVAGTEEGTETEPEIAAEAETAAAAQSVRIPRGTSSTKVTFVGGSAADAMTPNAGGDRGKTGFPWGWAAGGAAVLAAAAVAIGLRKKKK